jgi:uncharacterized Tic20 family protein
MDDQNRTADEGNTADRSTQGEGVPIPGRIREAVDEIKRRAKEETDYGRDVVQEYEERYHGRRASRRSRLEAPAEDSVISIPVKAKRRSSIVSSDVNERKWAALAHASTLLTALVGLATGGAGVLVTMFIPLCIYFAFRRRSEYVAFHALQAFTLQLVGTVGWVALLLAGILIGVALLLLSILLILVLIGLILTPLVAIALVLFIVASLALPLGMVLYSVIAAIETWSGHDYRIPYIARWVESQMHDTM